MRAQKNRTCCLVMMMLVILCLSGCGKEELDEIPLEQTQTAEEEEALKEPESDGDKEVTEIYVYVCGQVVNPGVYCLPTGSRIYEALEAAGGVLEGASPEMLNQAGKAEDGQKIYVPSAQETVDSVSGLEEVPSDDGKININTADKEQLITLPGIGESKAEKIIEYREKNGNFKSIDELMEIQGIKEGVFEKIKDRIKV